MKNNEKKNTHTHKHKTEMRVGLCELETCLDPR